MSDILIPGITSSGIDTESLVERIMESERAPLTRLEARVDAYEEERLAWQEIGRRISNLQAAARALYGFENPFNERAATSADERILTATARRNAPEGTSSILVRQIATADRFISRNLADSFTVPAGRYGFRVGESEQYFTFAGGSLESFAQAINQRASDLVSARVVRNTATTRVILIEAKRAGSENPLSFLQDGRSFALSAGLLQEVVDRAVQAPITATNVTGWTRPAAIGTAIQAGTLTVQPGGEATVRLSAPVTVEPGLVMEFEVDVRNFYEPWVAPPPPPGPDIPSPGSVTLGDVTVFGTPSSVPLPEWQPPEPPVVREDMSLLFLRSGTATIPLPPLSDTDGFQTVQVPLERYAESFEAVSIRNNNTHREVAVRNIRVFDPRMRGDVAPVNALSTAADAIVEIDGIEVVRPSNTVDDLIPGVTLTLRNPGPSPVEVTVTPDRELVADALIAFVFYYNELLREINVLTRSERAIVDELTSLSREEREEVLLRLGLLQENLALNRLKSSLQTTAMNAYPTSAGRELSLLAQMGISTNVSGPGGGFDSSRLRGYLEMNPRTLDSALQSHFIAARELFGSDTNGDTVIDTGVAFRIAELTRPYIQVGGLVPTRTGGIASSISQTRTRIEREEARLARVETEYRQNFARMESALSSMQESQRTLDSLQNQTNRQ